MPNYRTHLQDHHIIEQQTLKSSSLLAKLQSAGKQEPQGDHHGSDRPTGTGEAPGTAEGLSGAHQTAAGGSHFSERRATELRPSV
ncbi:hypothetical protein C1922_08880 [Stenotrophomonas sp. ZAC14D2_NAIMI4_7]|nr:hypothetical protein C1922_08880 [Stenotrophomonas sp. ZAC14D2_NAIMI4_7]